MNTKRQYSMNSITPAFVIYTRPVVWYGCVWTRPAPAPLTPIQRAEYASERLLSALRAHVAGDDAAWGRVETERALLIGAVVAAHDAGGAP